MRETAPREGARGIVMCHISHAYPDGASLYFTYIFPRALDGEIAQWQTIKKAASDAIAKNGGTISHHHGVGEDHLPWMQPKKANSASRCCARSSAFSIPGASSIPASSSRLKRGSERRSRAFNAAVACGGAVR